MTLPDWTLPPGDEDLRDCGINESLRGLPTSSLHGQADAAWHAEVERLKRVAQAKHDVAVLRGRLTRLNWLEANETARRKLRP